MPDDGNDNRRGAQADAFAEALRASARQVWLAGLGALARAQQEGSKLFDSLVQEGAALQPQASERFAQARSLVQQAAAGWSAKASERLDAVFEERVGKALDRLDVPLGSEVDALVARIEELERAVAALEARGARRRAPRTDAAAAAPASGTESE